jgi:hypothetical protein
MLINITKKALPLPFRSSPPLKLSSSAPQSTAEPPKAASLPLREMERHLGFLTQERAASKLPQLRPFYISLLSGGSGKCHAFPENKGFASGP